MDIRGARQEDIQGALVDADPTGNLIQDPQGASFRLRVIDSKGRFHRRGHSGRRMVSACWHGHLSFLRALYRRVPDAVVLSRGMGVRYESANDLEELKTVSENRNVGSIMNPLFYGEACDCLSDDGELIEDGDISDLVRDVAREGRE